MKIISSSLGQFPLVATATINLTSAQVKALRATPITVIPAPASGSMIYFLGAQTHFDYGGTNPFTNAQNLALQLAGGPTTVSSDIVGAGYLDQTVSAYQYTYQTSPFIATALNAEGQALVLTNTGGSEITGNVANDNLFHLIIYYSILTFI